MTRDEVRGMAAAIGKAQAHMPAAAAQVLAEDVRRVIARKLPDLTAEVWARYIAGDL